MNCRPLPCSDSITASGPPSFGTPAPPFPKKEPFLFAVMTLVGKNLEKIYNLLQMIGRDAFTGYNLLRHFFKYIKHQKNSRMLRFEIFYWFHGSSLTLYFKAHTEVNELPYFGNLLGRT